MSDARPMLREIDGLAHQVRMERLAAALADRSIPVAHCEHGRVADRTSLWLDDGSVLELRLYRPASAVVAALTRIHWDDRVGWVVAGRATDGTPVVLRAWHAAVTPPGSSGGVRRWGRRWR